MCIRDSDLSDFSDELQLEVKRILEMSRWYIWRLVQQRPVSYTHLDVYKRQVAQLRKGGTERIPELSGNTDYPPRVFPDKSAHKGAWTDVSVSYTHLDVYKRQVENMPTVWKNG